MNLDTEALRMWMNLVVNTDPYTAINNVLRLQKDNFVGHQSLMSGNARQSLILFAQFFHNPNEIHKAKMLHIDKDLFPTILHTDNKVFFRKMSLPCMFLNQDFKFENYLIKGIMLIDMRAEYENMIDTDKVELDLENPNYNWDNINVLCMFVKFDGVTMDNTCEEWLTFHLLDSKVNSPMTKFVSNIVVNILDFMNNDVDTIDVNTIVPTREEQKKAVMRGKPPTPTKVYIRPKQQFRKYYLQLNDDMQRLNYSHRFVVRGFFRHFRSPKWKNKQGTSTFIKPFIKGKGIFIEKNYKLED